MPRPKYSNHIICNMSGRWEATLRGQKLPQDYDSLDDAVDALLMEESFACARVAADYLEKHERISDPKDDALIVTLKALVADIRSRAKQEAAD